jgi:hypothetical protein
MNTVFPLLILQGLLGAFDNLWRQELKARLPYKRSAIGELSLRTARDLIYACLFVAMAWFTWNGAWAGLVAACIAIEIAITIADFLVEDKTRRLPGLERALHTILAINFGGLVAFLLPELIRWYAQPTAIGTTQHGGWSWLMTIFASGALAWAIWHGVAVVRLARPARWQRAPMRVGFNKTGRTVLITGATGFIGRHLCERLLGNGERLIVQSRDPDKAWDLFGPYARSVRSLDEIEDAEQISAIINLAGAPIIGGLWTARRKRLLVRSRLQPTVDAVKLIARLRRKPELLISRSAVGYYGIGLDPKAEDSPPGRGFQSSLCQLWEHAAQQARRYGTRVCLLRTGVVLGHDGGALPRLLAPYRLGLATRFGDGKQWLSWIHIDDLVELVQHIIAHSAIEGPVNATAPGLVTQEQFMRVAGRECGARIRLTIPRKILRALLGELAELFVDGQRVYPRKAIAHEFRFQHQTLVSAVRALALKRAAPPKTRVLEVFYDGVCPVCSTEVGHYAALASWRETRLAFADLTSSRRLEQDYGLCYREARKRFYAVTDTGDILSGIDAFLVIWERLPGYRHLAHLVRLPGIYLCANLLYDLVLAPAVVWLSGRWQMRRRRA